MTKDFKHHLFGRGRYKVDAMEFNSIRAILSVAKLHGYTGCVSTLQSRLSRNPVTTAKELFKNVPIAQQEFGRKGSQARVVKREREKAEMAALIAEMDARKKT